MLTAEADDLETKTEHALSEGNLDEARNQLLIMRRVTRLISEYGGESLGADYRRKYSDLRQQHHSQVIEKYFVIGD